MNVYVRTDATARTGAGHFMRCIALGQALGSRGASLTFLMREPGQSIAETLSAEGFGLHRLQESEGAASELQAGAGWLTAPWEFDAEQTIHAM
ncbi:MAG TPA: UDP-2,4-diacetamido-2,4,6-trideoxy-beta-L-altropyranose hydrolase, partial [Burkholderiales bacterium]